MQEKTEPLNKGSFFFFEEISLQEINNVFNVAIFSFSIMKGVGKNDIIYHIISSTDNIISIHGTVYKCRRCNIYNIIWRCHSMRYNNILCIQETY